MNSIPTRIVTITAARTYVAQHTIEIPDFCRNDRLRGIVANGGATARLLSERMVFGRIIGTGLAQCLVSDSDASPADFPLSDLAAHLRKDGFKF
ncbi:hypothetical protein JIN85_17075 [Luteolibacter pohnpeiensis]|uniref:Uncharacterized protein n=1 Tax=Luteolibacter pohnpeiensis TaxID=454153 RepID=A0A934VSB9_9BACT|nr:hypothetical protein [Luteolibacter pohnpeiensis]MBK1884136.1 hypothetical protein [Luteolibacter pohnpeiensis]